MPAQAATVPTGEDPARYCAALPTARRREEGAALLELFAEVTGAQATMWGPSMIGFGLVPGSGSRSDSFRVGFSPRQAALSLYGLQGHPEAPAQLDRLGKHRRGAGCVYVNGLRDIDPAVLRELVAAAWRAGDPSC